MVSFEIRDREDLRAAVQGTLDRYSSSQQVRAITEGDRQFDRELWNQMGELGWTSLLVPEAFGGSDAGMSAAVVVLQALGGHFTPSPYLSSAVLATSILAAGASAPAQKWLPALAQGEAIGAVAMTGPGGRVDPRLFELAINRKGEDVLLSGTAHFVLDGEAADVIVVGARDSARDETVIIAVDRTAEGVAPTTISSIDRTRQLCDLQFAQVVVDEADVIARGADAETLVENFIDVAAVALAADATGAALKSLDMAVNYSKQRVQFDRVIGSFQAIKHKLADMYVLGEACKATVSGAALSLDSSPASARQRAASAGSFVRQSASRIVGDSVQVHGGIGFTWEHDCHMLLKRGKFDEIYLTDLWSQRCRLIEAVDQKIGLVSVA
jgi:alkylation response protein AidB-like acyl-CoA dehydrogenase